MLQTKAMKVVEEANELKEICMKNLAASGMFEDMSGDEFEMYQKLMRMLDESMELVLEQAKMFDELDNKLDRIMRKIEA